MMERYRLHLLNWWAKLICRWSLPVLLLSLLLAVASVAVTYQRLRFEPDRNALISPDLEWNRQFDAWRQSFEGHDDFYLVVDPGEPGEAGYDAVLGSARRFVNEVGPLLQNSEHVERVVWGFGGHEFSPRAVRLLPMAEFQERVAQMAAAEPLLASGTPEALFQHIVQAVQAKAGQDGQETGIVEGIDQVASIVSAIGRTVNEPPQQRPSLAALVAGAADVMPGWQYLTTENERLLLVRITPRKAEGTISAFEPAIAEVRGVLDETLAKYPGVAAGLTGIDVVESDETAVMIDDSTVASVVAAVLIAVMLVTAYRGWRTPLLAMVSLGVGIAWSFGFATLVVGHLQLLSVFFTVILLGLGIAYGVHLASRLERVRGQYPDNPAGFVSAMQDSMRTVGPGVITGAITTAAAFCTTLVTDFKGVAEMGAIAAAGIVLCLGAMFTVYPALLRILSSRHAHFRARPAHRGGSLFGRLAERCVAHPKRALAVAGVVSVVGFVLAAGMRFDYDLMKLQPRGIESVKWQQRVIAESGESIWAGVCIVESLEQAKRVRARLAERETVGAVRGIGLLDPAGDDEKVRMLVAAQEKLAGALADAHRAIAQPPRADPDALVSRLKVVHGGLAAILGVDVPAEIKGALDRFNDALGETVTILDGLPDGERYERVEQLQREYTQWRVQTADRIGRALDPSPLTPGDLPKELLRPYVARKGPLSGRFALEVHPNVPKDARVSGPLDPRFLPDFIGDLAAACEGVGGAYPTGVVVQIYESGFLIKESYKMAGLYALGIVLLLVWMDFRSSRYAVVALVPVAVGFVVTFGIMRAVGISINPANIVVLPLMFGIGVDSGVHVLHRFRQDPATRPLGLTHGTGKGITVTSLTTMVGFGAMVIARHRGIESLGFVMALGVGLTLVACWTVMPAWLEWRSGAAGPGGPAEGDSGGGSGSSADDAAGDDPTDASAAQPV